MLDEVNYELQEMKLYIYCTMTSAFSINLEGPNKFLAGNVVKQSLEIIFFVWRKSDQLPLFVCTAIQSTSDLNKNSFLDA